MRKLIIAAVAFLLIAQTACVVDKNKYKTSDIYEHYEADNGFTILHLPPVLFKIALSVSDNLLRSVQAHFGRCPHWSVLG